MKLIKNSVLAKNIISPGASQDDGIFFNSTTGRFEARSIPAIAITDTYVVASETEQLALTVQKGDTAIRTDENKTYINSTGDNLSMTDWAEVLSPDKDELVKASATDTTAGYLDSKIDTTKMVMSGETISVKDYAIYPKLFWRFALPTPSDIPPEGIAYVDGIGIWRTKDDGSATESIAIKDHNYLVGVGENDHHAKSHSHTVSDGSGAIATDQEATFGDVTNGNYLSLSGADGTVSLFGTSRYKRFLNNTAYNMYPYASTYNGISTNAAGSTMLDGKWYCRSFDDGLAESCVVTFELPSDYEDGTDIDVHVHWTAASTTGGVAYGLGLLVVGDGEVLNGTETYITGSTTAPAVAYEMNTVTVTFTDTGFQSGDSVSLILYRNPSDAADTMVGDALVVSASVGIIANKLGGGVI